MTRLLRRMVLSGATTFSVLQGCARSHERDRVDFERMRLQQRYDLYAEGAFPNGAVVQTPPDSSVPREALADSAMTAHAAVPAAATLPIPVTPALLATGKQKFATYCAVCHGAAAFGGSLVAVDMGPPRPPSLRRPAALSFPAGYIYTVATNGLRRMPAYAPQLTVRERWAVVAYVQQLQHDTHRDVAALADSTRAAQITHIDSIAALEARK